MKAGLLRALEECVDASEEFFKGMAVWATEKERKKHKEILSRARQGLKSLRSTADPHRRRILRKHKEEK